MDAVAADDAIGRAAVLHLHHHALAGPVGQLERAAMTPSSPAPSKRSNQSRAVAGPRLGVKKSADGVGRARASRGALKRQLAQVPVAEREQVERDEARRSLLRELLHARRGGVDALLQRVEVEPGRAGNDELAVEDASLGKLRRAPLDDLGEVALSGRPLRLQSSTSSPSLKTMQRNPSHFGS